MHTAAIKPGSGVQVHTKLVSEMQLHAEQLWLWGPRHARGLGAGSASSRATQQQLLLKGTLQHLSSGGPWQLRLLVCLWQKLLALGVHASERYGSSAMRAMGNLPLLRGL